MHHVLQRFLVVSPTILLATTIGLPAQDWVARSAAGPSARQLPRMAYDFARAETVLFGGFQIATSGANAETWRFDGTTWTVATPATVPPARDTFAISYDLRRGVVVMFGGVDSGAFPGSINNETWEWDGVDWTLRTPPVSPAPRFGPVMAYDQARGVHVLFGGSSSSARFADTWEYDGVTWRQVTTANAPSARTNGGIAYDLARGRIVLFGGSAGTTRLGDTWEYDGTDWTQITTANTPPARGGQGMVYDLRRGRIVMMGGLGTGLLSDTWEYDGNDWFHYRLETSPGRRTNVAMAYDVARGVTVLFGGAGGGDLGDTWELTAGLPSASVHGAGCAGSAGTPRLAPTSLPALGTTFGLEISGAPPAAVTALLFGVTGSTALPVPLTPCTLFVASPVAAANGVADGSGISSFTLAVPGASGLAGFVLETQGVVVDLGANALGLTLTDAVRAVVD